VFWRYGGDVCIYYLFGLIAEDLIRGLSLTVIQDARHEWVRVRKRNVDGWLYGVVESFFLNNVIGVIHLSFWLNILIADLPYYF
jgi:hypothetical protein